MILDDNLEFADALTVPTATGRALLGDVVDSDVVRDLGMGKQMYVAIQVTTAILSGGSATVAFELVSDAQAAILTDDTATKHGQTFAIPKAQLTVGAEFYIPIPPESPAYERFLGIISNVGTAALTAGKVNAFLTLEARGVKAYPDAVN